ncbi:PTS sugar transporter subunit IIA [Oceanobacillus manasiensis]|uniref:PTS sugar transporter subunit IIA n=1 Tax=Oceanobacillus manasiensis TaxID=586413 RepID=UPI0005AB6880|nr:PTS sugar transporter subunit IIA [Oceanobacillus manasiensis]
MSELYEMGVETFVNLNFENSSTEKVNLIKEIAQDLSKKMKVQDLADSIITAVNERERLSTTGFGNGIAIPHGKVNGLKEPYLAFYNFANPIDWEALDDEKVVNAFVILVPDNDSSDIHLRLISTLAYNLMDETYQTKISTIRNEDEMKQLIKEMFKKEGE